MNRRLVIRKPIPRHWKLGLSVISVLALVGLYEALSHRQHVLNPSDTTIPSIGQMATAAVRVCTPDSAGHVWLWDDFAATASRHCLGLALGVLLSVVIGVSMGCFPAVEHLCLPTLSFLAKVPPTAMLAVFFVLVGHEMKMFVAMIGFGVLPTLTQAVYQSAKYDVPSELVNKAYTLGASNTEVVVNVVFHQILPRIIEAVRLQVGPAMVFLIAAEWMVADVGFGYRLRIQSRLLNMAVVYVYIIVLGVLGYLMDWCLTQARLRLCPWFEDGTK